MFRSIRALALAGVMISLASASASEAPGSGFVDVTGGKLWTESCGAGPETLVLLHDGTLHSATWDDVWPGLCKSLRVVRYDRRGYGRSPAAKAAFSELDDLEAVIRASGAGHVVLVGASHGGGIALDFALAHPGEVERLVLVGPDVPGVPYSRHFLDRTAELTALMMRGDFRAALKGSWLFAPGDDANVDRALKLTTANLHNLIHNDVAEPLAPVVTRLGEIKVPTLILVGESDVADNHAKAGLLEYAIHGSRRVVVRGAGHLLFRERPEAFVTLVLRFVEGRPTPGAEEALQRLDSEIERGAPDYSRMSPGLAAIIRQNLAAIRAAHAAGGALRSRTFQGQGTDGADVFIVTNEHGSAEVRITLGEGGRIEDLRSKPMP